MPNGVQDFEFHERLCIVEARVERLPIIESKVDQLHDDMTARKAIKETTDPGVRLSPPGVFEKLGLGWGDVIKGAVLIFAVGAAILSAKPGHEDLKQAAREVLLEAKK